MIFKIDSGELKHLIKVQELVSTKDSDGFINENWQDYFIAKAKINNTSGKEYQKNMATASSIVSKFIIRASRTKPVTTKHRIFYDDKHYNIQYVNNILEANEFLELIAELVE